MCDRCSHSLFHAPDLNNSPRADNPCTQDHLHGTAEPGNFRLRPSVRFCSITAPRAQGAPFRHVSTQPKEESPLFLHRTIFFSPSPPLIQHVSLRPGPSPWRALLALPGNIFQIQSVARVEVLSCSFFLLGRPPPHFLPPHNIQPPCPGITLSSVGHRAAWKRSQ